MVELLAPAGDFERMQFAIAYGANAVYLSGTSFGLRAKAKNFDDNQLEAAIEYAHNYGVRVYVTANIFAHNNDVDEMRGYFKGLAKMGADAFIISDPGVMMLAKEEAPNVEIHISTQANTTNYASANFWQQMGASRVILARELSLAEISKLREKSSILLEGFVHGAMCMSYSGRCMLSKYMTDRDANLGACAHPCRYDYSLYVEEKERPGNFMPVRETERGTDIFAADDLCMIEHIPKMIEAGLSSLKIEGRMKSAFYVGLTTLAYRRAIDDYYSGKSSDYMDLLKMASHRTFSTGFYFNKPLDSIGAAPYERSHDFVGIVRSYENGKVVIEQRGKFEAGDILTFIQPKAEMFSCKANEIWNENGIKIASAPHSKQMTTVEIPQEAQEMTLVCKTPKQ